MLYVCYRYGRSVLCGECRVDEECRVLSMTVLGQLVKSGYGGDNDTDVG